MVKTFTLNYSINNLASNMNEEFIDIENQTGSELTSELNTLLKDTELYDVSQKVVDNILKIIETI